MKNKKAQLSSWDNPFPIDYMNMEPPKITFKNILKWLAIGIAILLIAYVINRYIHGYTLEMLFTRFGL